MSLCSPRRGADLVQPNLDDDVRHSHVPLSQRSPVKSPPVITLDPAHELRLAEQTQRGSAPSLKCPGSPSSSSSSSNDQNHPPTDGALTAVMKADATTIAADVPTADAATVPVITTAPAADAPADPADADPASVAAACNPTADVVPPAPAPAAEASSANPSGGRSPSHPPSLEGTTPGEAASALQGDDDTIQEQQGQKRHRNGTDIIFPFSGLPSSTMAKKNPLPSPDSLSYSSSSLEGVDLLTSPTSTTKTASLHGSSSATSLPSSFPRPPRPPSSTTTGSVIRHAVVKRFVKKTKVDHPN